MSERLTPEQEADIRFSATDGDRTTGLFLIGWARVIAVTLLAELDAVRTERDRLANDNQFLHRRRGELVIERDRALAENKELRAALEAKTPPKPLPPLNADAVCRLTQPKSGIRRP